MTKSVIYSIIQIVQFIGLSPNGKATDSDSVIFKVRILVAQLKAFVCQRWHDKCFFCIMELPSQMFHNTIIFQLNKPPYVCEKTRKEPLLRSSLTAGDRGSFLPIFTGRHSFLFPDTLNKYINQPNQKNRSRQMDQNRENASDQCKQYE